MEGHGTGLFLGVIMQLHVETAYNHEEPRLRGTCCEITMKLLVNISNR